MVQLAVKWLHTMVEDTMRKGQVTMTCPLTYVTFGTPMLLIEAPAPVAHPPVLESFVAVALTS